METTGGTKKKFILVRDEGAEWNKVFQDLYSDERAAVIEKVYKKTDNPLIRILYKIHNSRKINRIIPLPFKEVVWFSKKPIEDFPWEDDTQYYMIFPDWIPYYPHYLNRLKEKHRIKYVLLVMNPWDSKASDRIKKHYAKCKIDYVLTFDIADSEKYKFLMFLEYYSMLESSVPQQPAQWDLYYSGSGRSDRISLLFDLFAAMEEHHIVSKFMIFHAAKQNRPFRDKIIYIDHKMMPYEETLKDTLESNCILEVLSPGQTGPSLRYFEAICYHKKLLTNNKRIVEFPFYNPEYIQIFEQPEDIDWEWVKERIPVDYHYDGRFSPVHLIDKIIELENQKEGSSFDEKETS